MPTHNCGSRTAFLSTRHGLVCGAACRLVVAATPEGRASLASDAAADAIRERFNAAQAALSDDLIALVARFNRASDGAMVVPGEYLEIVITRR